MCNSDANVKSALQAWSAYGQSGIDPVSMFKPANALRQAFAFAQRNSAKAPAAEQQKKKQPQPSSTLPEAAVVSDAVHQAVTGGGSNDATATAAEQQGGHKPQPSTSLPEAPGSDKTEKQAATTGDSHAADAGKFHDQQAQAMSADNSAQAVKQEVLQAGTDQQQQHSLTGKRLPGFQTQTQRAPAAPQNAFALLMRASKGTIKEPQAAAPQPQASAPGLQAAAPGAQVTDAVAMGSQFKAERAAIGSPGKRQKVQGQAIGNSQKAEGASRQAGSRAGWSEALQRVAADPERCLSTFGPCLLLPACRPAANINSLGNTVSQQCKVPVSLEVSCIQRRNAISCQAACITVLCKLPAHLNRC